MNADYEKRLETAIDRELKALPPLRAPEGLAARVLSALAQTFELPWYRRAWQTWPLGLRTASFALLLAVFCGICFAASQAPQTGAGTYVSAKWHAISSSASALATAGHTILSAGGIALKKLGTGYLLVCFGALALGYLFCVGLGTVTVRLAWARR